MTASASRCPLIPFWSSKRAGVPADLINALLDAKGPDHREQAKNESGESSDVRTLYQAGKYGELVDKLSAHLRDAPNDYRSRAILVTVLLKLHDRPLAVTELKKLHDSSDPSASNYAQKLDSLLAALDAQEDTKKKLEGALRNYNTAEAESSIAMLPISGDQRALLGVYLDVYGAHFAEARNKLSTLGAMDYQHRQQLLHRTQDAETAYLALMQKVDFYLHSPLAASCCNGGDPSEYAELDQIKVEDYVRVVNQLAQLAPLSERVMDLVFHSQMIASQPEQLIALGDRLLQAKGNLKLPFYSSDRFFWLVIDARSRKLYTEPDDHEFVARYAWNGGSHLDSNARTNRLFSELIPFNIPFSQIHGLKQNGKAWVGYKAQQLKLHTYAVRLEPSGVAPHYAFMHLLVCKLGEGAELRATNNLGQFLVHVIDSPGLKAELADPAKAHSGSPSGWSAFFNALYDAAPQHTALETLAHQSIQEADSQQAEIAQQQQEKTSTWIPRSPTNPFRWLRQTCSRTLKNYSS